MRHWAGNYIGKPWVNGGAGPDGYDCWGLVRAVHADVFGCAIGAIDVDAASALSVRRAFQRTDEYERWTEIDAGSASDGDVVLMSQARYPHHVGVIAGDGVLHSVEGAGVVHQRRQRLALHGWNVLAIYRRRA